MLWNKPRYMLTEMQQLWRKLWNWKPLYWLRCHTFTKYHIIDIRGQDGYDWGWIDRSHAMYLACFALLVDFVEKEDPTVGLRTEANYRGDTNEEDWNKHYKPQIDHQLANEAEIRAIYDWWKTGRKQEQDACEALIEGLDLSFDKMFVRDNGDYFRFEPPTDDRWNRWTVEHDRLEAKDEEMFLRLIKIRGCLWT